MTGDHENRITDYTAILVFKERAGCEGGGKGILITENKSFTLSTLLDEAICYTVDGRNFVLNEEKSATLQSKGSGGGIA